ncbi:hypothetical protein GE061_008128 [Apolygus lucorum]|uniref:Peptidase aspartic putative domain-containing protein n=1 Tax=Apolygus lucorum TaxID=248454 RepID=A0A8S9WN07_APOLU|nr:hypothetical protein GE061_008128 [Apolygus lucorum]
MEKLTKIQPMTGDSLESLSTLAAELGNVVTMVRLLKREPYLHNPFLMDQMVSKLNPSLRLQWGEYARSLSTELIDLGQFSHWLDDKNEAVVFTRCHRTISCRYKGVCKSCGGGHNSILHPPDRLDNPHLVSSNFNHEADPETHILFKVVPIRLFARTVANLSLPSQSVDVEALEREYNHIKALRAKPLSYLNGKPVILIGQDNWPLIVPHKVVYGPWEGPVVSSTKLGWIIHGTIPGSKGKVTSEYQVTHCSLEKGMEDTSNRSVLTLTELSSLSDSIEAVLSFGERVPPGLEVAAVVLVQLPYAPLLRLHLLPPPVRRVDPGRRSGPDAVPLETLVLLLLLNVVEAPRRGPRELVRGATYW